MKREEFIKSVEDLIENYINNFGQYGANAQLRVNPELLTVEIESGKAFLDDIGYSDEVIENAAYAEGDETESSSDYQASQNYNYYPVSTLLKRTGKHTAVTNREAIEKVAVQYFK